MKFSFIVPSVDSNGRLLQDCIDSIEKAYEHGKGFDIEILVVFQGAEDGRAAVKTRHAGLAVFYNIKEKGLARARNYAIGKNKGDFLIFLDDDARVREDFLEVLRAAVLENSAGAFCGRILEKDTGECYTACFEDIEKKDLRRKDFRYFMGSSHVLRRSAVEKTGFYDEKFGVGAKYPGAEESDMFFRMKSQNEKVLYIPELVFFHPISYRPPASKAFDYSYASGAMLTKQIIHDWKNSFVYIVIIAAIVFKSLIRAAQAAVFFKGSEHRNARFHYGAILKGVPMGIIEYVKEGVKIK
jgi:glycosyltransferase involved in cell wall biosynthesis